MPPINLFLSCVLCLVSCVLCLENTIGGEMKLKGYLLSGLLLFTFSIQAQNSFQVFQLRTYNESLAVSIQTDGSSSVLIAFGALFIGYGCRLRYECGDA